MDNFDYQAYLKSGKIHGESKQVISESQEVTEKKEDIDEVGKGYFKREHGVGKKGFKMDKRDLKETIQEAYTKIQEGSYPFDQCVDDNEGKYGAEGAKRVCGAIRAAYGEGLVNEMDEVSWNDKNNPSRSDSVGERDPKKVGQSTAAYSINEDLIKEEMSFDDDIDHKTNKNDFAFWYRAGARGKAQALKARELLTKNGIDADYSKGPFYISFENSDVEERVVQQMLRDANLARFVIMRNENLSENARTDAEQEGYKDGFEDAKDDIEAELKKMKVSELKAKIREDIIEFLSEQEEDVDVDVEDEVKADVDVDVEDDVNVDAEGDEVNIKKRSVKADIEVGLSPTEELVQDSLEAAMKASEALGDEVLTDQIGNTITYFTRKFVVGRNTD